MEINKVRDDIYAWVDEVGWHNKTPLECVALIHEEVAELSREIRGNGCVNTIGNEMADIILRTLDLSKIMGVDIRERIKWKLELNRVRGARGREK